MSIKRNGIEYSGDGVDIKNKIVTFDSQDALNPQSPVEMPLMESGNKVGNLFKTISMMAKNIRYLLHLLGTTDISDIADGTVTGALVLLNMQKVKIYEIEKVDNPITSRGQYTVWEASGMLFIYVVMPVQATIGSWQSIKLAKVKNWPSTKCISTIVTSLANQPKAFLVGVTYDGSINLVTHGEVTIDSWCYGSSAFPS